MQIPMNAESLSLQDHLVESDWLAARLDDPGVRILEISYANDDSFYREGHLPDAIWRYWKDALWHATDRQFPAPEEMARRLGAAGITEKTTIVLCGDPIQFGTYAFWVLKMCGHADVRILNGGKKKWAAEGKPLTQEIPDFSSAAYQAGEEDFSFRVGRDDVRAHLGSAERLLLDVRSDEEYSGERVMPPPNFDHGAERTGHIPGAVHLFYGNLFNEDDTFKTPGELKKALSGVGADPEKIGEIVVYCRLSHRATLAWFSMHHLLGYENVKVYDGSWTEWGSIVGFPIEK